MNNNLIILYLIFFIGKYFTNDELEIENNNIIPMVYGAVVPNEEIEREEGEEQDEQEEENNQNYYNNNNNYDENEQNKNSFEPGYDSNNKEEMVEQNVNNIAVQKFDEVNNENDIEELKNKKKNKVSFGEENDELKKKKREESFGRAMKRLNNRRRMDKNDEDKNKVRKSNKIQGMAGSLEDKIKNNEGKFYVDLEYEQNKDEQENYNY